MSTTAPNHCDPNDSDAQFAVALQKHLDSERPYHVPCLKRDFSRRLSYEDCQDIYSDHTLEVWCKGVGIYNLPELEEQVGKGTTPESILEKFETVLRGRTHLHLRNRAIMFIRRRDAEKRGGLFKFVDIEMAYDVEGLGSKPGAVIDCRESVEQLECQFWQSLSEKEKMVFRAWLAYVKVGRRPTSEELYDTLGREFGEFHPKDNRSQTKAEKEAWIKALLSKALSSALVKLRRFWKTRD